MRRGRLSPLRADRRSPSGAARLRRIEAALICRHFDDERQREVAARPDEMVRAERAKSHKGNFEHHKEEDSGSQPRG